MKKGSRLLIGLTTALILLLTGTWAVWAAEVTDEGAGVAVTNTVIKLQIDNPVMTVNGQEQAIDESGTTPVLQNDRTLLPVRAVVEAMGGTVTWDDGSKTATLSRENNIIRLTIDNTTAYLNDIPQTLDVAPVIIKDRTMLPIRFIAERFGFEVDWNGSEATVTITSITQTQQEQPPSTANHILVAYYSHTGNTEAIAQQIHEIVGGDIFKIETVEPYPEDYDECVAQVKQEQEAGYLPPLKTELDNIAQYDVIFFGYPIWFGTIGPPLETFLSEYDLTGKTIVPFCTYGGSGLGQSVTDITERCPQSTILDALALTGDSVESAQDNILEWLRKLEMID